MSIRIGLLGAGRIGQVHARTLAACDGAELVAVADALPAAATNIAEKYGCPARSVKEIEADSAIDAVLICTPNDTHAEMIERFTRAGKAIFCEKPIDLDAERVRRLIQVVEESGGVLMTGFNRRFDPHFRALKDHVSSGAIGNVETVMIISRDPAPPPYEYIRQSGGIFRDMTIHDLDLARFFLDEPIDSVTASASVLVDKTLADYDDWDTASVILTTGSGRHCIITNSRRATYGYDQRIEIHGSEGLAAAGNPQIVQLETADGNGFHRPVLTEFFMTRYVEAYAAEISEFIRSIREGNRPAPSGQDGLMALLLADAATESAKSGKTVKVSC